MKMYSKDGVEMMDIQSFDLNDQDILVMKGKMMGAMAATVHIKPEDLWAALKLLPGHVLLRMPALLWKGWQATRRKAAQAKPAH